MHCVSLQWLYDSARRGYCLAETSYSVGGGAEEDKKKTDNGEKNKRLICL